MSRTLRGTMTGTWCERSLAKKRPDPRSYRWVKKGKNWLLIGCPKGSWQPRTKSCAVGTRAVKLLTPANGAHCARGRRIKKG